MRRTLLAVIMSALAAGGMSLAQHGEHGKDGDYVKLLSQKDIIEKLDGKKSKATTVEVTLAPGQVEAAVLAWQVQRNERGVEIDWQFTAQDARIRLKHLYPSLPS